MQFDPMKRREFITLLGGAAAWPLKARAQQRGIPVVGWIRLGSPNQAPHLADALRQGLRELGFVEGQNVTITSRFAENRNERFRALADDLVDAQVDVIAVPATTAGALAAQAATKSIPVVFMSGSDPVEIGLVASFARPGGNLTGVGQLQARMATKRIQMLHELVPTASTLALLTNPRNPYGLAEAREVQAAAQALRLELRM